MVIRFTPYTSGIFNSDTILKIWHHKHRSSFSAYYKDNVLNLISDFTVSDTEIKHFKSLIDLNNMSLKLNPLKTIKLKKFLELESQYIPGKNRFMTPLNNSGGVCLW